VCPRRLLPIAGIGLLVALFLIFVARPLSVHLSLVFSNLSFREQMLVAWVGLRGAVPIVLATFPVLAGIQHSDTIFHLVFFIALTSVLVQGPPIPWIARKLQLDRPSTVNH
jgi:cell volume regulation protein A